MPIPPFAVPQTTSDDQLQKLAEIFKPIKIKGDKAFLIKPPPDLAGQSFLWEAEKDLTPYNGDLYTLDRLWTVHTWGYYGFFKPSIAEVLQQIPKCYTKLKICYFETVGPEDAQDMNLWSEHVQKGVHVAKTTLYLPHPTSEYMARYWHHNRDMLAITEERNPAASAVTWLDAMEEESRRTALRHFCRVCGKRLTVNSEPSADNYCDEHAPKE